MDDPTNNERAETGPEREVPAPEQVWGSEHAKLSGPGWRRLQQLEPVKPIPPRPRPPQEPRAPQAPHTPQVPEPAGNVTGALEELSRGTDERLSAIEHALGGIAKTVKEAAWSTSASDVRSELDALRRSLASLRGEAFKVDPTREIAQFLQAETERIRGVIGEEVRTGMARSEQDMRAVERLRKEVETLGRSLAELRTSLPSTSTDELAGIVQDEARATREVLARLRAEGPAGERDRLDAIRVELESVRATVQQLVTHVAGVPSSDDITRSLEDGAERSRASIQEDLHDVRRGVEEVRRRSESLDAALTELVARQDSGGGAQDRLVQVLRSETDRIRIELAQAAEATDARARGVLGTLARELLSVAEQQKELREELHRLATRIVGRPLL